LPLHTLRADIDYGFAQAYTTYGVIGVKCWIYKGEIIDGQRRGLATEPEPRRPQRRDRRDRPERSDHRPGDRPGDRRSAPPVQHQSPAPLPIPAGEGGGVPEQTAPGELSHPRIAQPIAPPLAAPQPSWKQELKQESAPAESQAGDQGNKE
ncbi:MAG: 30S ribosomal protein S3, partial [Acidobacteria bacterium]|nr:30S ribosomal protein S3 [Acidobacteriota bacterium]